MRKKMLLFITLASFMSLLVLFIWGYFLFFITAKGIPPSLNSVFLTQSFAPERLLSLSLPTKSSLSISEEILPEWVLDNEMYYELFPEDKSNDNPPEQSKDKADSEGKYPIVEKTFKASSSTEGVSINNSSGMEFNLKELINQLPDIALIDTKEPQVLIVHTHATESYSSNLSYYTKGQSFRSTNNDENMVGIGKIVTEKLKKAGYSVIHDTKQHDNPNYNTSYSSSNTSIKKYLAEYPSIKVVLDIHRDSITKDDGTQYSPIVTIDGKKTAQVMILLGTGNPTYVNEHWLENLKFSIQIQKIAASKYPDFMRPILMRNSRYNQHLSNGGILVEVGSSGNTLQEAQYAAEYFTECLIEVLNRL